MEVVASLSQGRTAAVQCGLFTHESVPVIFEPPCTSRICGKENFRLVYCSQIIGRGFTKALQRLYKGILSLNCGKKFQKVYIIAIRCGRSSTNSVG